MVSVHRSLLGVVLIGNAIAFAGVDPVSRTFTAAIALVLVLDLRRMPEVPRVHRWAIAGLAGVVVLQLLPLPEAIRRLLQPGFAEVFADGWAPLSLAPWATLRVAASLVVAAVIALVAARMTSTRSGLPAVLTLLASTGAVLAVLGLAGEAGAPEKVLLIRDNSGGGAVYGPYVNANHFAVGMELTIPAAMVLLAAAVRRLSGHGASRQRAAVMSLAAGVACAVSCAALVRSGSRGGVLFFAVACLLTAPLWLRRRRGPRWRWIPLLAAVLAMSAVLMSTRLPLVRDEFRHLLVVDGLEGNSRWDLWEGTLRSWRRAPALGSGLGSYRYVIGLDKPATHGQVLRQAHNDWLEWLATGGVAGGVVLVLTATGVVLLLRPRRIRWLRYELRYPMAGAALAVVAVSLHEMVGFGLQMPLNRYLVASWIGVLWGLATRQRADAAEASDDG